MLSHVRHLTVTGLVLLCPCMPAPSYGSSHFDTVDVAHCLMDEAIIQRLGPLRQNLLHFSALCSDLWFVCVWFVCVVCVCGLCVAEVLLHAPVDQCVQWSQSY